ncbi:hypothetical protein Axi01nite_97370 [Actinoplanes xinjiangensis]|nr:hypothetical protein Axi01nite_97370 [Actinoplanes xinjiangensis]
MWAPLEVIADRPRARTFLCGVCSVPASRFLVWSGLEGRCIWFGFSSPGLHRAKAERLVPLVA